MNNNKQPSHARSVSDRRRGAIRRAHLIVLLVIATVVVLGGAWAARKRGSGRLDPTKEARCKVMRGDLTVTVLQAGELEAKRSRDIKNDTGRQSKILFVVDDGARVKKGDLLVELDSEELRDQVLRAQSDVARAEAELAQAEKQIEIEALKYATDLATAKLKVELAEMELKKYDEAEYPQQKRELEIAIKQTDEDLSRARDKLEGTRRLLARDFASKEEEKSDEMAVSRLEVELESRREKLRILEQYTDTRQRKEKENAVSQALADLNRLQQTYESGLARDKANLEAKRTQLAINRNMLRKQEEQVASSRVYSQVDGQVFYPKQDWRRSDRNIEKGAQVYPQQQILAFPDLSAWSIKVGMPESIIDKIKAGQEAVATIDAMPGEVLRARVERISVVPDSSRWFDPSAKSYTVSLDIPTTPTAELKPGMSVMVEIVTGRLEDVLYVPIQAVTSEGDRRFVYVVNGKRVERVEIETGANNEESIQVVAGVREGQELLLYAPVDAETRAGLKERPLDRARRMGVPVASQTPPPASVQPDTVAAPAVGQAAAARETAAPQGEGERRQGPEGQAMDPEMREKARRIFQKVRDGEQLTAEEQELVKTFQAARARAGQGPQQGRGEGEQAGRGEGQQPRRRPRAEGEEP